jgi:hypothetical protein
MFPTTPARRTVYGAAFAVALLPLSVSSATAATAAGAPVAAPAPNGTATVAGSHMVYTGLDGPNRVTVVNVPSDRFLISDTAPITSGAGCIPATVPAGLFGVSCTAPITPTGVSRPSG